VVEEKITEGNFLVVLALGEERILKLGFY